MFKINFPLPPTPIKMNHSDPILLMGSCFSYEIGKKLAVNKMDHLSNPFGTIYNPISLFRLLSNQVDSNEIVENQDIFYHWSTHSSISSLTQEDTIALFEDRIKQTEEYLKNAKYLIITPGTAIIYEHNKHIVANCHKVPSSQFEKRFLTCEEISESFSVLHKYLEKINEHLQVLFTVSPVRHIKDGLIANNRSKSILLEAVHQICEQYDNSHYFPSYEIVIDELRDYRFFDRDMIHPSAEAVDYIWKSFSHHYFGQDTLLLLEEWTKLRTNINHRPFHPTSDSHQRFLKNTIQKAEILNEKMDLGVEIKLLKEQLIS